MSDKPPAAEQPPDKPDPNERDAPPSDERIETLPAAHAEPDDEPPGSREPDEVSETAGAEKVEPEAFALRGRPVPAIRFRREVVVAATAAAALGLLASAWFAFRPVSFQAPDERRSDPRTSVRLPDVLADAPRGYDAIPVLGRPLPGDLGRPILARQRSDAETKDAAAQTADEAVKAERARVAAAALAARQSGVLMPLGRHEGSTRSSTRRAVPATGAGEIVPSAPAWLDTNPHRIVPPPSPWVISGGSVLSASLLTGINSDAPGLVVAQLTENAYDSITGRTLLIPQGSRLIGTYDNDVGFGQRRLHVSWQRIVWPNGASLRLGDLPAADAEGHAGLADRVDIHAGQIVRGAALSTLLGVGTELTFGNEESELIRALREGAQQSGGRAGDRLIGKALEIEPTILVRPGWPVRVIVQEDLILQPWRP